VRDGKIVEIRSVANPESLAALELMDVKG
jgi:hypothetical protein